VKERLLWLYCRWKAEAARPSRREGGMLYEPRSAFAGQAGLSKLAITVILVAVGVSLTLAVVAILGPRIFSLAEQTGDQIDSVPLDWGQ
jgi:hypothetical protein